MASSTITDQLYAFLAASLGVPVGSVNDAMQAFTAKYSGGLDSYMGSMLGRRFVSGLYYTYDNAGIENTLALGADVMVLAEFTVGKVTTFDQMSIEVTAAGAGSTIDLAIYDTGSNGKPNNRVATVTGLSGAAVAIVNGAINVTLQPGTYWLGYIAHGATPPTVRSRALSGSSRLGAPNAGAFSATAWVIGSAGAPPATAGAVAPSQSSAVGKVLMRAA